MNEEIQQKIDILKTVVEDYINISKIQVMEINKVSYGYKFDLLLRFDTEVQRKGFVKALEIMGKRQQNETN